MATTTSARRPGNSIGREAELRTAETVTYIDVAGGATSNFASVVDPAGNRLGVQDASALAWLLPDLHGNVAGQLNAAESAVVWGTRYDPWGEIVDVDDQGAQVSPETWTYQGRLDVSPAGLQQPLLEFSARYYSPGLGAFSQLDTVMGSAQDPRSMNRFLYAHANPATLVDPTGHAVFRWNLFDEGPAGTLQAGISGPSPANQTGQIKLDAAAENSYILKAKQPKQTPRTRSGPVVTEVTAQQNRGALARLLVENNIDPMSGCHDLDLICAMAAEVADLRALAGIGIGLFSGLGDLYQAGTVGVGYDPIADVHFSDEDRRAFASIALSTAGLGFSPGYLRKLDSRITRFGRELGIGPFSNTLPERLDDELELASTLGVRAMSAGDPGFAAIANQGRLKWAVTENGELLFVPRTSQGQEITHSVIAQGRPVLAAGEAEIAVGGGVVHLIELSNYSGHYLPTVESLYSVGVKAFADAGISWH